MVLLVALISLPNDNMGVFFQWPPAPQPMHLYVEARSHCWVSSPLPLHLHILVGAGTLDEGAGGMCVHSMSVEVKGQLCGFRRSNLGPQACAKGFDCSWLSA